MKRGVVFFTLMIASALRRLTAHTLRHRAVFFPPASVAAAAPSVPPLFLFRPRMSAAVAPPPAAVGVDRQQVCEREGGARRG